MPRAAKPSEAPTFFSTPAKFRAWLEKHHQDREALWVGFYKTKSGKPSITWPESVDQALCFGWIDGIRKTIDDVSYKIRFTPRTPRSNWSTINIGRVAELERQALMMPAGRTAFAKRADARSAIYADEQRKTAELAPDQEAQLRANAKAWSFFQAQAPWYRRTVAHWIVSAKKEETKQKRLAQLIEDSAHNRRIAPLTPPGARKSARR